MKKTGFAGLTVIEPNLGDSIYSDGGSFLTLNPQVTDKLLRVGALSHRHDGHAPLVNPTVAPALLATNLGGQLNGSTRLYVGYTAVDTEGGETAVSPLANATTPPPLAAPAAPAALADYTAGGLAPGSYRYAISVTDGRGGETLVGAPVELLLTYGQPNAQVHLSGLAALVAAVGGDAWRLYRSIAGAPWAYMIYGAADAITDDGTLCADCSALPPATNSTNRTGSVQVTVPALPAGTTRCRIYAGVSAAFASPSLVGDFSAAQVGAVQTITSLAFLAGAPPAVSTSVGGADPIDPETDLEDFHWHRPVPTAAALPALAEQGDVRLTLDTNDLWAFDGVDWIGPVNANPAVLSGATTVDDIDALEFEAGSGIGLELTQPISGRAHLKIVNTASTGTATVGVRNNAQHTTAALASNAGESSTLTMGKTFSLLAVATDAPARVRIYTTPAKRDADIARPSSQAPTGDHGLIAEFVTAAGQLAWQMAPMTIGADLKAIPDGTVALRVTNRGAAGAAVTVTATHVPIET
jgi:hypothetical protein